MGKLPGDSDGDGGDAPVARKDRDPAEWSRRKEVRKACCSSAGDARARRVARAWRGHGPERGDPARDCGVGVGPAAPW